MLKAEVDPGRGARPRCLANHCGLSHVEKSRSMLFRTPGFRGLPAPSPARPPDGGPSGRPSHRARSRRTRWQSPADPRHGEQRPADRIGAGHCNQAPIEACDLGLESRIWLPTAAAPPGERRDALVLDLAQNRQQLAQAGLALCGDDPQLAVPSVTSTEYVRRVRTWSTAVIRSVGAQRNELDTNALAFLRQQHRRVGDSSLEVELHCRNIGL